MSLVRCHWDGCPRMCIVRRGDDPYCNRHRLTRKAKALRHARALKAAKPMEPCIECGYLASNRVDGVPLHKKCQSLAADAADLPERSTLLERAQFIEQVLRAWVVPAPSGESFDAGGIL